jgi:uncharacterized protein with ParB-like and HNH nuclease domain
MESTTTIKQMLAGNRIVVPTYQRAYSWDTELESSKTLKQVNTFLHDLENHIKSGTSSKYYFGHFLFEERSASEYGVIDGQQRLTTIVIFLSALFSRIKSIRELSDEEDECFEDLIVRKGKYRFLTVDYDRQLFKDYVIDQIKKDKNGLETESAKRIVSAFEYFTKQLSDKDESYLVDMLKIVQESSCTTHPVKDESEAIQMFIFQNNRGKKPSNLEVIKAQFMFAIHLKGGDEKEHLLEEIKERFEKIYKSISSIENEVNEDDILLYTLRVYFNSLWESNSVDRINKKLTDSDATGFIKDFTRSLAVSFEHLKLFYGRDERENNEVHSIVSLGGIGIAIPFIIKAYTFDVSQEELSRLCTSLESLVVRHRLIGTRADMTSRINGMYQNFTMSNPDIKPLIDKIEWMKNVSSDSWWWAYWSNQAFESALQGKINHKTANFLLWKYENYLESQGRKGYLPSRFDKVVNPELEHIAPQTENPESGYDIYDEEFINQYIDCIGNYLLISKSHNCSVGNKPFKEKRDSYKHSEQQREIQEITSVGLSWTKELIMNRKNRVVDVLMTSL